MKKKLILIFGLILVLTGCGDNKSYIKNKVLNEFKENNIYSYFNADGLKMIQEAGFKQYKQIVFINKTDITLKINFETKQYTIRASGSELLDYVFDKNISFCKAEDEYAVCETNVNLEGNSIMIPSSGDEVIDNLFNHYPIMINNLFLDEDYINSLSNPIATESRNNPLGGSENAFHSYEIDYENVIDDDNNIQYFVNLGMKRISRLGLGYTNYDNNGESFLVLYGPPKDDYNFSTQRNAVMVILGKGEKYE